MAGEFNHPDLAKLTTSARAKVETALKATLERELASRAVGGGTDPQLAAHSRSQGAFFSRSKTSDKLGRDDDKMMEHVTQLDDEAFQKFASRLATLKNIKKPG